MSERKDRVIKIAKRMAKDYTKYSRIQIEATITELLELNRTKTREIEALEYKLSRAKEELKTLTGGSK